jgi:hypothetical protein
LTSLEDDSSDWQTKRPWVTTDPTVFCKARETNDVTKKDRGP